MDEVGWRTRRMHRRKLLLGVTSGVAGTWLLSCCGSSASLATNSSQRNAVLALIEGVQNDPFYITMQRAAQKKAKALGATLLAMAPARFDASLQIPLVNAMIARKVDVLIVAACDKVALIEPLKRAYNAGIKVISVDTFIGNGDYTHGPVTFPLSYIGSDNMEGGRVAGMALIKALGGQGKIYIQNFSKESSTAIQREQGCEKAIRATHGAVTLVGVGYGNDSPAVAAQQTAEVLRREHDLAGVFGTNLFSAVGAAQAIKDADKQGVIKVASFDAPEQAIMDLRNGVIDIVIAQKPAEIGSIAVDYAIKALQGETNGLQKRVVTDYVIIDNTNVDTPEAQKAIYRNS